MATQVYFFAFDLKRARDFLEKFEQIMTPLLELDPIDTSGYTPPKDPPPPPSYRCTFEDNRHQNDALKQWVKHPLSYIGGVGGAA